MPATSGRSAAATKAKNGEQPALRAEWAPTGKDRAARTPGGRLRAPEQSPGAHDQHDRHDQEDEDDRDLRKDEDAKGVELGDDDRREEGAQHAAETADHDDDQRLGDHLHVHRVARGFRGNSSAPPNPARKTPSAKTLVNSHFWLTPSAATISRS